MGKQSLGVIWGFVNDAFMFKKTCIALWVNEKLHEVRTVQYSWPKVCRNLHNLETDSAGMGMLKGGIATPGYGCCGASCTVNIIISGLPLYLPVIFCLRTHKKGQTLGKESSAGTGSAVGQAGFLESMVVLVRSFLKKLAFLPWVNATYHAVL